MKILSLLTFILSASHAFSQEIKNCDDTQIGCMMQEVLWGTVTGSGVYLEKVNKLIKANWDKIVERSCTPSKDFKDYCGKIHINGEMLEVWAKKVSGSKYLLYLHPEVSKFDQQIDNFMNRNPIAKKIWRFRLFGSNWRKWQQINYDYTVEN